MRRLIETDEMPIRAISEASRRDQNIRKGHLHTLHVWWATRPLAACRATLLATLLPDPVDEECPQTFRERARQLLRQFFGDLGDNPYTLRRHLMAFIALFAQWELAHRPLFVQTARELVSAAHPDGAPLVVDPFSGMGSIPFEALRLGADAFASDLNPVAVLLNRVALEYLPTYGERLAEAVQRWGEWVLQRAREELAPFYPQEPDGSVMLATMWARAIRCEAPGCGAEVPMVGLLWLSRKPKERVALRYWGDRESKQVRFEIFHPQSDSEVQPPIAQRFAVTCPVCGYTTPYQRVREQIRAKRGGTRDARPIAVITLRPDGTRGYRLATDEDLALAHKAAEELARREREHQGPFSLVPDEPTPTERGPGASRGSGAWQWNFRTWGDLFHPRQALALTSFVRLVREAYWQIEKEIDTHFANAGATCLSLATSNAIPMLNSISYYGQDHMRTVFQGSGMPMRPDFAEANPLVPRLVGGVEYALGQVVAVLQQEGGQGVRPGTVRQASATALPLPDGSVPYVATDPPYYDAITYADLSDLCYVWLKRMLYDIHPDLFRMPLTPKEEECIADPGPPPPGLPPKTREHFERTMQQALAECRRILKPDGHAVVIFAHKGTAGWEAMLNALVQAGWTVTSSWPIETERAARMLAKDSAVLASSVFLVCRPRPVGAGVGEWRRVWREMGERVAAWLPRLEEMGVHGADAIFSCIGPALEVYSRYERVETAGGEVVSLRTYLAHLWEAIAREALGMLFREADASGFEEDARLTALWLWSLRTRTNGANGAAQEESSDEEEGNGGAKATGGGYTLPYDDARLLIQALGAHEESLRRPGGILAIEGNKARLRSVSERRRYLFRVEREEGTVRRRRKQLEPVLFDDLPSDAEQAPEPKPGDTVLDRVHQAMLLFADGQSAALRAFLVDEGAGREAAFWRLAEVLSRLYPPHSPEKRWVDGVLARRSSVGL